MDNSELDRTKMTVTMSVPQFEFYEDAVKGREMLLGMLMRSNCGDKAIMTDELREFIEEIYL